MNRRSFLRILGGAAAAAVAAPATKYFFAPAGGWEWDGNLYTRLTAITLESLQAGWGQGEALFFLPPGTYPFEIDYDYWVFPERQIRIAYGVKS